jgi:hypothetical protein
MCLRDKECSIVLAKNIWFFPLCAVNVDEVMGLYTIWYLTGGKPSVVDYFMTGLDDNTEFSCICMHVSSCFKTVFKTLLSSLA